MVALLPTMMPDNFQTILSESFRLQSEYILHPTLLKCLISEDEFSLLEKENVIFEVEWEDVNGRDFPLHLGFGKKSYIIRKEFNRVSFEPTDGIGGIIYHDLSFSKFVKIDANKMILFVFAQNSFSRIDLPAKWNDLNITLGKRMIHEKNVFWAISLKLDSEKKASIQSLFQEYNPSVFLYSLIDDVKNLSEIQYEDFMVSPIAFPLSSEYWKINTTIFINRGNGFRSQDLALNSDKVLVIDTIEKFIYLYGIKLNNSSDSNAYKYIVALCKYASSSEMDIHYFCENHLPQTGQSFQAFVQKERSQLKKQIEKKMTDRKKESMC